ncbi:TPA: plasminogen-binding N-terminal domain-containing protein [Campylobacter coli]|nr:exporting protein [Campylobacter coli]EAI4316130.1 exporting protein [Campylobacter coli]ELK4666617.1 plasminogen-binding N-terminal domain-containing protein [Campylobacter coli]HDX3451365.1 plasminogen-binding N-terminal domain-containing protein [Campylobacter coli]HEA8164200.1 plasminogen-binding N-terminal domain-containing protein [Campylobacter coli]
MLKFLTFILSLSIGLFAADLNLKPVKTELLKVEDIYGYIKDSSDIKLNSSGVVIQRFQTSKSIIARASVIAKEKGLAKLKFSVFADLEQDALPLPNVVPQKGDEVVLNFLYDRGLVIAPDEQTYNKLVSSFPEIYFTHIDILGAQLIRSSSLAPKRSDFRKFCADNAVGILIFALEDRAKMVDCQDFSELYELAIAKPSSIQVPFYSRIGGYKSNFFDFNSQEVGNYYRYYDALINLPKAN